MIVAVTGSRMGCTEEQRQWLKARLIELSPSIAHLGDARGVDTIAKDICMEIGIPFVVFVADWSKHGVSAGPIRNGEMLEVANTLIALPGGKGTANCVNQAKRKGIRLIKWENT